MKKARGEDDGLGEKVEGSGGRLFLENNHFNKYKHFWIGFTD
jgi:hypothetical protein